MPLKHFDGGQATGGAADAMVSSHSGTASFDMSMEDAADVPCLTLTIPKGFCSLLLKFVTPVCYLHEKLTAVHSVSQILSFFVIFLS